MPSMCWLTCFSGERQPHRNIATRAAKMHGPWIPNRLGKSFLPPDKSIAEFSTGLVDAQLGAAKDHRSAATQDARQRVVDIFARLGRKEDRVRELTHRAQTTGFQLPFVLCWKAAGKYQGCR